MKKGLISKTAEAKKVDKSTKRDVTALVFFICYLAIDFLPGFNSGNFAKPQFLYLAILNVTVAVYLYFDGDFSGKVTFITLKNSLIFRLYLAFILICGLSVVFARNATLAIVAFAEMAVFLVMFLNLAMLFVGRLKLVYKVVPVIAVCVALKALYALSGFFHLDVSEALGSDYFKSNTGNINIFSMSFLIKMPFLFTGILHLDGWRKWLLSITIALSCSIVFLINARASLLALLIILAIFIIYYLKIHPFKQIFFKKLIFIILPVIISFGIANGIFKTAGQSNERFSSTINRFENANTKDFSVSFRLKIWKTAIGFTKANPILGIGLDNWRVESIPFEPQQEKLLSLHTHNDFLQFFAETGLVNGFIYLSFFAAIFFLNLKTLLKPKEDQNREIALLALLILIVFTFDSIFNFPYYIPTIQLQFCFCIVLTVFNGLKTNEKSIRSTQKKWLAGLVVMAILPLFYVYQSFKTSQFDLKLVDDDLRLTANLPTLLSGDEVVENMPFYPNVMDCGISFDEEAGAYYARENNYAKARLYLDKANTINPYFGRAYYYKSLAAHHANMIDSAYEYIKTAISIRPNNSHIYQFALQIAEAKKDTTAILKMYGLVSAVLKKPADWLNTLTTLKNLGYSGSNNFMLEGFKEFPNDTNVVKYKVKLKVDSALQAAQKFYVGGKFQKAVTAYKEAAVYMPDNASLFHNIGLCYLNLNQMQLAIKSFLKGLDVGSVDGKAEYYLSFCYFKLKDKTNGCKYLKLAAEKNFPDESGLAVSCN